MKTAFINTDCGSINNFFAEVAINLEEKCNDVSVMYADKKIVNVKNTYDSHKYAIDFYFIKFIREFKAKNSSLTFLLG